MLFLSSAQSYHKPILTQLQRQFYSFEWMAFKLSLYTKFNIFKGAGNVLKILSHQMTSERGFKNQ